MCNESLVDNIKKIISRYPFLDMVVRKVYWFFWRVVIKLSGQSTTSYRENKYSRLGAAPMNAEWLNHKSKKLFCSHICRERPFESLCEVGCNSGANLVVLAKEYPGANYIGVDINKQSVDYGNAYFSQEKIPNVKLMCGKVEDLDFVENKSFDIVVTNALLYIMDQKNINISIRELVRIAKRKLILFELNYVDKCGREAMFRDGYWVRDYRRCFLNLGYKNVSVSNMPLDTWESYVWKKYGAIVTVDLCAG